MKIILADNPLRETVTADGPISLEDMFEVGYLLIAGSVTVGASTSDPTGHFLKQTQARTAMAVDPHFAGAIGAATADNAAAVGTVRCRQDFNRVPTQGQELSPRTPVPHFQGSINTRADDAAAVAVVRC